MAMEEGSGGGGGTDIGGMIALLAIFSLFGGGGMLGGARGGSAVTPVDLHLDGLRTVIAENAAAAASCCCQTQGAIADAKYAALLNMKEMEMAAANCCLSFMAA